VFGKGSFHWSARRKEKAGDALKSVEVNGNQIPGEVSAAIAMTIKQLFETTHDLEATVLTIERIKRAYSPWSSKIYGLRQIPNRR
jgi:hypothetical protein